jgi:hypothetical protein
MGGVSMAFGLGPDRFLWQNRLFIINVKKVDTSDVIPQRVREELWTVRRSMASGFSIGPNLKLGPRARSFWQGSGRR